MCEVIQFGAFRARREQAAAEVWERTAKTSALVSTALAAQGRVSDEVERCRIRAVALAAAARFRASLDLREAAHA